MSEGVWISLALYDYKLGQCLNFAYDKEEQERYFVASSANDLGVAAPANLIPDRIVYVPHTMTKVGKLPHLFKGGIYWCVSEKCATILREFDLGAGGLFPVKIEPHEMIAPTKGEFFMLNFGAQKEAFVLEQSKGEAIRENMYQKGMWSVAGDYFTEDGDIVVGRPALDGPDLWMDPGIRNCFFVSETLAQALIKAGMKKAFQLYQCKVV